jgi:hypothetical protein
MSSVQSIRRMPREVVASIGRHLCFQDRDSAFRSNTCFAAIHARSTHHTWVMARHPGKSAVDRLRLLLARMPLLEELEVVMPAINNATVIEPWEIGNEFISVFGKRRLILAMPRVANTQSDSEFVRLMLRPFVRLGKDVVSVSNTILYSVDACKELLGSGIDVNHLYIIAPIDAELYGLKDSLLTAATSDRVKNISMILRRGTSMWLWSTFVRALSAIPGVVWRADYACSPEDATNAAIYCTTVHINRYIIFNVPSLQVLTGISNASRRSDARIRQLVLGNAPTIELLRHGEIMRQLRDLDPRVEIILTGDSIDSGTAAFIERILKGGGNRRIGICWPCKVNNPNVYARAQLTIARVVKALGGEPRELRSRFFVTVKCSGTCIEKSADMLAVLSEDERALWMI